MNLTPYILGFGPIAGPMLDRCPADLGARFLDINDPANLDFYRLVNAGNNAAYGDLGMPPWVQLDCCTLPSAMIGFALPREAVEDALYASLIDYTGRTFGLDAARRVEHHYGLVPISEYCGIRAWDTEVTIGFSMFSLIKSAKIGVRTKALALRCYGTRRQIGTTQWSNPAIRAHCRFGPLRIVNPQATTHSRPLETFLYELILDDEDHLLELARHGASDRVVHPPAEFEIEVHDPSAVGFAVAELIARQGPLQLVAPGLEPGPPQRLLLAKGASGGSRLPP